MITKTGKSLQKADDDSRGTDRRKKLMTMAAIGLGIPLAGYAGYKLNEHVQKQRAKAVFDDIVNNINVSDLMRGFSSDLNKGMGSVGNGFKV